MLRVCDQPRAVRGTSRKKKARATQKKTTGCRSHGRNVDFGVQFARCCSVALQSGADAVIRTGCVVSVAAAVRSPQGIQSAGENVRWKTCLADVFFEVDVSFVKSDEMEKLEGMETVPASHFPHSQVSRPVSCLTNAHPTSIKPRDETPNLYIQTRDDDDGMITTRAHQMITHVALVVVKPVSHIKGLPRAASPLRPPQETERPPSTICRQPGPREAPTLEGTASRASGHPFCTVAQASPKGPIQSRLFQTDETRRLGWHGCARKKSNGVGRNPTTPSSTTTAISPMGCVLPPGTAGIDTRQPRGKRREWW